MINRLIICSNCGFHFYFNPATTNALILKNQKDEILFVKRKYPPKKGYWDLPGGFIEYDETVEQSVKRETKEELNVEITDLKYICSQYDRYLYKKINYHTICFFFSARIKKGKIKADDDISATKFFLPTKIPLEKIAFNGIKNVLKDYILSSFKDFNSGKNSQQRRQE